MTSRGTVPSLLLLPIAILSCFSQQAEGVEAPPTAETIMARVAANQDTAEAERSHYVYVQHALSSSRKGRTVMCEEITDSRITPSATGSHIEMLKLDGRQLRKDKYVTYTTTLKQEKVGREEGPKTEKEDFENIDRDLVEHMRSNLTNDKSKDGLASKLFPLTSKNQQQYTFHLLGRESKNGRDVFHINFVPNDKDDYGWKGDAYIDSTAYQPVIVMTTMSRKIPFAVRTLLGTNLPGLGFTVIYAPQPDGVWFPVSFGTEFKLHVLFFLNRQIVIQAQNRNFEKTHVTSRIVEEASSEEPQ
jgi:hypothetical protein